MKYIDAEKLREAVEETTWYHIFNGRLVEGANSQEHEPLYKASDIYKVLDNADVEEVKRGRWVSLTPPEMRTYETDVYFMCSECKNAVRFIANDLPYEHCPHCLARCEK